MNYEISYIPLFYYFVLTTSLIPDGCKHLLYPNRFCNSLETYAISLYNIKCSWRYAYICAYIGSINPELGDWKLLRACASITRSDTWIYYLRLSSTIEPRVTSCSTGSIVCVMLPSRRHYLPQTYRTTSIDRGWSQLISVHRGLVVRMHCLQCIQCLSLYTALFRLFYNILILKCAPTLAVE